ncbi:hypothetical protein Tco_0393982 [Tanacetum coccineum]
MLIIAVRVEVGDRVLLKVTPWKGVVRFGKKGKLAPRYAGPFEILERIGLVAYRLRLLEELSSVHDTFHVSNLKKCLADANLHVPLDEIKVDKTLRFVEEPIEIMDQEVKKLKRRKIALVKVRWNSKWDPEFTWEHEDQMRIKYEPKGATNVGNASQSSSMLKKQPTTTTTSTKEGNTTMSNSYAALGDESDEDVKNVYDESANLFHTTIGESSCSFMAAG